MTSPHFAWLPPEVNSALMFAGPGAGPLIAAAAAWEGLAQDLAGSAASFESVTSELASGSWLGPSSAAMMVVAAQYMAWLSAAAGQAEQAAGQAMATVIAFETALAATVQPAVVAANRGLVQLLAATNFLGMNAPAIMDIESAYEQMWALDVAAMAGYHFDASAAAAQLAPWQNVLQTIGIDIGANGQINLGWGNTGSGNIGNGNHGSGNFGSGNTGNNNAGTGNTGSNNVGGGNTGTNNTGFGNWGNGNIGFGNTGNGDIGFGLTGNHQIGFGGFNSGSGNVGFGNSGTGNSGFFNSGNGNMGIGNSGTQNTGFGNSGAINTGFGNAGLNTSVSNSGVPVTSAVANSQVSTDTSLMSAGRYAATGAISMEPLSSSILNTALGHTGDFTPAPTGAPLVTPTAGLDAGGPASTATNSGQYANPGLRNAGAGYPGFCNPGTHDPGVRSTTTVRESEIASPGTGGNGSGVPRPNFHQTGDRNPGGDPRPGLQQQTQEK